MILDIRIAQLINCVIKVSMGHFSKIIPILLPETDKIEIESPESEKESFGDGEILGQGPKWEVEVVKDCLKVFTVVPKC